MTPIVLQHGLFGFSQFELGKLRFSYFHKIDRALAERGHPLIIARVHPTGPIELRAAQLKRTIIEQSDRMGIKDRVVILAHSMGGLDARFMIAKLGMANRVMALVTISTPHRGSAYADWCFQNLGQRLGGVKLVNLLKLDMRAIADLMTESCRKFNDETPDHPDVGYYSISAARPFKHMPPFLMHSHEVIHKAEGENDGMVSVASAQWGNHLETWPADHFHVINKRFMPDSQTPTGSIIPYYLRMLERVIANQRT